MIDIETTGTTTDCKVLAIAVVRFSEDEIKDMMTLYPSIEEQKHRIADFDTMIWWLKNVHILNELLEAPNKKSIEFCQHQLNFFIEKDACVWAKSPSFDLSILSHLFKGKVPWSHRTERDVRTAQEKLKQKSIPITKPLNPHDPLSDATAQAVDVMKFLNL